MLDMRVVQHTTQTHHHKKVMNVLSWSPTNYVIGLGARLIKLFLFLFFQKTW